MLGVSSFFYGLRLESIPTIFRWLTVDGTLFTTISAIAYIAVNLVEVAKNTELMRRSVYYLRLSSAVAESVIFIVVLFSQLPVFPERLPIFDRYDSFVMHALVPLLGVESFLIDDVRRDAFVIILFLNDAEDLLEPSVGIRLGLLGVLALLDQRGDKIGHAFPPPKVLQIV